MKKLAESERENRQKKIMKQIERMAEDIKVNKFFGCDFSSTFTDKDINLAIPRSLLRGYRLKGRV